MNERLFQRFLPYFVLGGAILVWLQLKNPNVKGLDAMVLTILGGVLIFFSIGEMAITIIAYAMDRWQDGVEKLSELYAMLQGLPANVRLALAGFEQMPEKAKVYASEVASQRLYTLGEPPIAPDKVKLIARASLNGIKFSLRNWSGPGKPLSDPEARAYQDWCLQKRLIREKKEGVPQQGYVWTNKGNAYNAVVVIAEPRPAPLRDLSQEPVR